MSTAHAKRPYAQALADAEAFRDLFPASCYERWEIAGSLRCRREEVGDVEHVVIPRMGEVNKGGGLFVEPEVVCLLWHHLDAMLAGRGVVKHVYSTNPNTGAPLYRWGEKYRGVDFRGFNNEIFTATADNFGSVLAIRTGPAGFSQRLVTMLQKQGRRNKDGLVWRCEPCPSQSMPAHGPLCSDCQGTKLKPVEMIPAPDEQTYFELCGVRYQDPPHRVDPFTGGPR